MSYSLATFLNSRTQLLSALQQNPIMVVEYEITKYTKLPTGNSREECVSVGLKPKDVIHIEWEFDKDGIPETIKNIKFNDITYSTFNSPERIIKWLHTNSKVDENNWFI